LLLPALRASQQSLALEVFVDLCTPSPPPLQQQLLLLLLLPALRASQQSLALEVFVDLSTVRTAMLQQLHADCRFAAAPPYHHHRCHSCCCCRQHCVCCSQQSLALEVFVDLPAIHVALRILQLLIHLRVEAASVAVLRSNTINQSQTWSNIVKFGQT
jgi:hypothetical protein